MPALLHDEQWHAVKDAEQAVLGSIFLDASDSGDRTLINQVAQILQPDDFYWPEHQRIYRAMLRCDMSPNPIVVAQELNAEGKLVHDDCAYMSLCIVATPTSLDCLYYAEVVRRYATERGGGKPKFTKGF